MRQGRQTVLSEQLKCVVGRGRRSARRGVNSAPSRVLRQGPGLCLAQRNFISEQARINCHPTDPDGTYQSQQTISKSCWSKTDAAHTSHPDAMSLRAVPAEIISGFAATAASWKSKQLQLSPCFPSNNQLRREAVPCPKQGSLETRRDKKFVGLF